MARDYEALLNEAADQIEDQHVLDLVIQAEADEAGYNLKTLESDARRLVETRLSDGT